MGRLLDVHPRVRARIAWGTAITALGGLLLVAALVLLSFVVADVFADGATLADVAPMLAGVAGLVVARAVALTIASVVHHDAAADLQLAVRDELTSELLGRSPVVAAADRAGETAGVLGDAVDALAPNLTSYRPATRLAVVLPSAVFVTVAVLDPWSTLVLAFAGPMLLLLLALIGGRTRAITDRRFRELRWLDGFFLDVLQGLATLKAYGRSREEAEVIEEVSAHYGRTTMEVLRTAFQTSLVMEWAATAATALVAVEVGFRLVDDQLGFGPALAVLVLTPEFFAPLRRLALEYHAGTTGEAAAERILAVLGLEATAPPPATATTSAPRPGGPSTTTDASAPGEGRVAVPSGALVLDDVWATYPGAVTPALRGVSLRLEPGERVALVGPSGAGKSTVVNLLLRFLDPDTGTISVGGVALAALDTDAWRRQIGWVPQRPHLFAGTVADNIRLGQPDADDDAVLAAATAADADRFVRSLPLGYQTPVGEDGLRLSGGQRQRIAIARAFLRDPRVVLLDEFTAHLDPDTEQSVLDAFDRLAEGRTALVVAHRPRTVERAHRIVALDRGQVIDEPAGLVPRP
ncbi:MAG: thiol reductant ABC exporter subunit CydD [Acidimicrobiales bacterium]